MNSKIEQFLMWGWKYPVDRIDTNLSDTTRPIRFIPLDWTKEEEEFSRSISEYIHMENVSSDDVKILYRELIELPEECTLYDGAEYIRRRIAAKEADPT